MASIYLHDGRRAVAKRHTKAEALLALDELFAAHEGNLGYHYAFPRRRPTVKRKAISAKTRLEVFERDGFQCVYCGAYPGAGLTVDHIRPLADGGTDDRDNLATACLECNLGKGDRPLLILPPALAARLVTVPDPSSSRDGHQVTET